MSDTTMNNSDVILEAAIESRIPIMLVGDPGTAKTATVKAVAEKTNRELITIVPSRMDAQDLSGFPTKGVYDVEIDGVVTQSPVTEYAPQRWQRIILEKKNVVLFLDEFSNAHPSVRASLLSFIQDREFPNGDKFPDETVIIGAMNPTESAADGYEMDPATTNRILFHSWKPSTDAWLKGMIDNWGKGVENPNERKWRSLIVRFISDNPGYLHRRSDQNAVANGAVYNMNTNDPSDNTILNSAWASRRSWDNLSKVLGVLKAKNSIVEDTIMSGLIGAESAGQFRDWLRKNGALDISKIIKDPSSFEGWSEVSLDDMNLILRSAIDSVHEDSKKDEILNVIEIFNIIAEPEVDRASQAAPFTFDLSKVFRVSKAINKEEQNEIKNQLFSTVKRYQSFTKNKK